MSASPVLALRVALRAALVGDAALVAMLGGQKVYDDAPNDAAPPYVLFADTQSRDWSSDLSRGAEHFFVLSVVSTHRGVAEALSIADRLVALLDEAALTLQDHRLVDLRVLAMETRREQQGRFARVDLRFRAVTEAT